MGMYDQCLSIKINKKGTEIRGNHCTYTLYLSYKNKTLAINPMLSICLPVSCEEKDLNDILYTKIRDIGGLEVFNITSVEVFCSEVYSRNWTGAIVTM